MSILPDGLTEFDGPYRLKIGSSEAGVFAWWHVSDEHCTMLHDKGGNSVVRMESPMILDHVCSAAAVVRVYPVRKEWWANLVRGKEMPSLGEDASVVSTSTGQITRLIFDLRSGVTAVVDDFMSPAGSSFKLTSRQDNFIVSSTNSIFDAHDLRSRPIDDGVSSFQLVKADSVPTATTSLRVKIAVIGNQATISPGGASIHATGEGTNVLDTCLFEGQTMRK
ncbi:unnamed protein product [Hapterophycus canaliculatus]